MSVRESVYSPLHVSVTVEVEPIDVHNGLEGDSNRILHFILQLVALTASPGMRARLLAELGSSGGDPDSWVDSDYLPHAPEASDASPVR